MFLGFVKKILRSRRNDMLESAFTQNKIKLSKVKTTGDAQIDFFYSIWKNI